MIGVSFREGISTDLFSLFLLNAVDQHGWSTIFVFQLMGREKEDVDVSRLLSWGWDLEVIHIISFHIPIGQNLVLWLYLVARDLANVVTNWVAMGTPPCLKWRVIEEQLAVSTKVFYC